MIVFAPLTDPLEVIPLPLAMLRLLGMSRIPREQLRLYACMAYVYGLCFIPKIFLGYDNPAQAFRSIAELQFSQNTCFTLLFLPFKFDKFGELIKELRNCTRILCPDELFRSILVKQNRSIHMFTKGYYLFTVFIVLGMAVSTICGDLITYLSESDKPKVFPLMMDHRFYGLDAHTNIVHSVIHLLLLGPTFYILILAYVAKAGAFFGLIYYCSTIFHIVRLKIDRLHQIADSDHYLAELRDIIKLHQSALRCADLLEDILMYILLAQFTGCVLIWCCFLYFVMFSGFTAEFVVAVTMLISFSLETFIFCLLGNILSSKGEHVSGAIFGTNWYDQPLHIQKLIVPIISKAQRRVGLKAAKFYYVDVNRYGMSVKMAYSFYLLLKDIF